MTHRTLTSFQSGLLMTSTGSNYTNRWRALLAASSGFFPLFIRLFCLFHLPLSGYGGLLDRH